MRIQNRIKITIAIILIMTCIFSLTSCILNPLRRFEEGKPEYDYLVIEFSETSYAWVDCNNVDGYGEWTFDEKTIPITFSIYINSYQIFIRSMEDDLEVGKIYQYENPEEMIQNAHTDLILRLRFQENVEQNKIATCSIADVCSGIQDGMILSEDQEILVKKATSEEWQQWMQEHSLDPNLYMQ